MTAAENLLVRIVAWAQTEIHVRALILAGSRAQPTPADALADIDIDVFCQTSAPFTDNEHWLAQIDEVWICVADQYEWDGEVVPTRLVIFKDGVKVDFSFLSLQQLARLATAERETDYRVLVDKDGRTTALHAPTFRGHQRPKPTPQAFLQVVNEFWFEAYHVAQYLKRNDLWLVKHRDWATKEFLLTMVEWHAQARHDWHYDTYYLGKQLQAWVDPPVWAALHRTFAHFDGADSWRALLATIALFRDLATETAQLGGFSYAEEVDRHLTTFITNLWPKQ